MPAARSATPRGLARTTRVKVWAWALIGGLACAGGLLLWLGLAVVVRCERVAEDRVDVTVERRFLGWLTVRSEIIGDVREAHASRLATEANRGLRKGRSRPLQELSLITRERREWLSPQVSPSLGTRPKAMAPQIEQFIEDRSRREPLTLWWMPWLVNVAAVVFLLVPVAVVGEWVWKAMRALVRSSAAARGA